MSQNRLQYPRLQELSIWEQQWKAIEISGGVLKFERALREIGELKNNREGAGGSH